METVSAKGRNTIRRTRGPGAVLVAEKLPKVDGSTGFPGKLRRIHGTSPVYLPIHEGLIFMVNVGNIYHTWILWGCVGLLASPLFQKHIQFRWDPP